jgi:hypothetical protein
VKTYILGPFLALFPGRWRAALPAALFVEWPKAAFISGLAEVAAALLVMMHWYSHSMMAWVDNGVDSAMSGKMGPGVTTHEIAGTAFVVWITHPVTWTIVYFGVEGTVRLVGAALTDNILGTLPLYLVDRAIGLIFGRRQPGGSKKADKFPRESLSPVAAIRDKVVMASLPQVPDELSFVNNSAGEFLEIRACRTKEDWIPPRIVRYENVYYRLEAQSRGPAPRPFVYVLLKLSAGVPGRNVLHYQPAAGVLVGKKS